MTLKTLKRSTFERRVSQLKKELSSHLYRDEIVELALEQILDDDT